MTAEAELSWARTARAWHLAFYAMAAISALSFVIPDNLEPQALGVVLGAMGVLVVAYTVLAIPAATSRSRGRTLAYLAVLIIVTIVVVRVDQLGSIVLFIAYSQIWFFADRMRTGVLLTVTLAVGVWVAFVLRLGPDRAEMLALAAQLALSMLFSVLLGFWISHVVNQSQERAVLLQRLEAAQSELAAQHHWAGVAAERERFAQEIHDTLAQGFTSIVMLAQTASTDLDRSAGRAARERIALIEQTARENLAERTELEVDDDGRGIAPGTPEGIGLGGMRERVRAEGGDLELSALPDGGTRLLLRVPAGPPTVGP